VLCATAVVVPAAVALATGSFSIPQNDDWAFRRTALSFEQSGHLAFHGWESMTLVGQVLWSWPFLKASGGGAWALSLSTAVLGLIGVTCAYFVARRVVTRTWAVVAVVVVVLFPGFAWSTSTFMTVVPAFSTEVACLALGLMALDRSGRRRSAFVAAAMAVGVFGFLIREFVFVAPLVVLVCAAAGDTRERRRWYVGAGVVVLAVSAAFYLWWRHIPGGLHETFAPSVGVAITTAQAYFTVAFVLSPVVWLVAWRRFPLRPWRVAGTSLVVLALGVVLDHHHGLFTGNYLNPKGMLGGGAFVLGVRPILLPGPLRDLVSIVALVSGALLAGVAATVVELPTQHRVRAQAWGTPVGLVATFGAVLALVLLVYGLTVNYVYDRYLWPLAFAAAVLLVRDVEARPATARLRGSAPVLVAVALGAFSMVLVAAVSAALTVDMDAYDAARWHGGQIAVRHGVPASEVDAGFEWVGAHATGVVDHSPVRPVPPYEPWYAVMQPGFRECAVVSDSPLDYPGLKLVQRTSYEMLGFAARRYQYVYLQTGDGC